MIYLVYAIRLVFTVYSLMIVIRIFGSWFPKLQNSAFMNFIANYTDPYLNIFRRFIPPIGGVLDLSPLIGFFVLQFLQKFIFMIIL